MLNFEAFVEKLRETYTIREKDIGYEAFTTFTRLEEVQRCYFSDTNLVEKCQEEVFLKGGKLTCSIEFYEWEKELQIAGAMLTTIYGDEESMPNHLMTFSFSHPHARIQLLKDAGIKTAFLNYDPHEKFQQAMEYPMPASLFGFDYAQLVSYRPFTRTAEGLQSVAPVIRYQTKDGQYSFYIHINTKGMFQCDGSPESFSEFADAFKVFTEHVKKNRLRAVFQSQNLLDTIK